jgi:hypothetical protein
MEIGLSTTYYGLGYPAIGARNLLLFTLVGARAQIRLGVLQVSTMVLYQACTLCVHSCRRSPIMSVKRIIVVEA